MRHGDKIKNLSRTASHRSALLKNLAAQLFVNKRIVTTLAKAKSLRVYAEPLLTKSKTNTTHERRTVFSYLQNKEAVKELFDVVSAKILNRNGGYTRIIKLGKRVGDNAELAMIELVDFNELYHPNSTTETTQKTKRTRRGKAKATTAPAAPAEPQSDTETDTAEAV